MNTKERFDSIQLMRGLAAICVVITHFEIIGEKCYGSFGVDLFFCISGFIMMHVTEEGSSRFFAKRLIRVIPLYWMVTIFTAALGLVLPQLFHNFTFSGEAFIKSLLFIPYFNNGGIVPIVGVAWSLSYELFFYFIFYICAKINLKRRALLTTLCFGLLILAGTLINTEASAILSVVTSPMLLEFSFGMAAYEIGKRLMTAEKKKWQEVLAAVSAVLLFAFLWLANGYRPTRILIWGIPSMLFFLCVLFALHQRPVPRFFSFLGDISYSIYLVHAFPMNFAELFIRDWGIQGLCCELLGLTLTIAGAGASWYLIEQNFGKWIRRRVLED